MSKHYTNLTDGGGGRGQLGPELGALLGDGTSDGGTLHFTLGVDDDTGVVLEVDEQTFVTSPLLSLADDDGGHDLLTELGLAFLDGGENHVTGARLRETIEAGAPAVHGDDVKVFAARIVSAIHGGGNLETARHTHLAAGESSSSLGHGEKI